MSTKAESPAVSHETHVRKLQNEKAREVRLESLAKRDPSLKRFVIEHRARAKDLGLAQKAVADTTGELDQSKAKVAEITASLLAAEKSSIQFQGERDQLRADIETARASISSLTVERDSARAEAAELSAVRKDLAVEIARRADVEAEVAKLRADLAAALKKAKPAGGQ